MKFTDIYFHYKNKYQDSIVIYPVGTFYNILGKDTGIIHHLMGYQIKQHATFTKIGFPLPSLVKVIKVLEKYKINYVLLEKNNGIIEIKYKKKYKNNQYFTWLNNCKDIDNQEERLEKFFSYVRAHYDDYEIQLMLERLEVMYE